MRVVMMVDEKVLPKGGLGKITEELERRLKPLYPDAQQEEVKERIKNGVAISAIAREFKTSRQTIMRVRAQP